ncbi:hypothetical protein [Rheinheimera sp. UJ63]|uniref:hypothetical protein n=1 Tax=Rheinheimera sp. UJ63 TaxID=2910157 RepID=UPI001F3830E0|nr:hypothetical protein [Rheinheimera sp. UJ63]MCF4009044.1 hypothetical protein [Rheinheimera sp. UJ63]
MLNIRLLWILFVCLGLSACGGGGTLESGGGSSGSGGTGATDTYTLALTLTNAAGQEVRQVSTAAPGKLRATLKKNNQPLANQLVRFTLDGNVGQLSPTEGTARTNENGIAEIQLQAGETAGSSQVTASYQASESQTVSSAPYVFDAVVTGGLSAELSVTLLKHDGTIARSVSHFSPGIAEARLLIDGQPGAFQLIQFELGSLGVLNPNNGSAMTDVNGIARIDVIAGTEAGAGTLTARFAPTTTQTVSASPFVFTTAGDTPVQGDETAFSINLAMTNQAGNTINQISNAQPGIVVATVRDSLGQPVVNKVVSFVSSLGRIQPAFGTALTNELGQATVTLTAGTISGAGSIEASYQAKSQDLGFTSAGDEVISPYVLSLNLKDTANNDIRTVSRTQPGKIQATLTRNGSAVVDQLVSFSLNSNIGQLSPVSGTARTDANGVAELSLLSGQVAGSGQISAVVTIAGVNIQALPFVFDSLGDDRVVSSISLSLLDTTGQLVRDVAYATPRSLQAVVTENGTPVAFRLVTFSVEGAGEINPTTGRAMTDANGIARVDLLAGFVASAGEAQARYTNSEGAEIVSDTFTFTSAGDTPVPGTSPDFAISLTLTNSAGAPITEISQATPGVVQATVVDKDGQPVVNKVVSFSSTLGRIQPAFGTALTDSNGVAQVRLTAGTVEGAGTLTARYQGVEETLSFRTQGNEGVSSYLMTLNLVDAAGAATRQVSRAAPGRVQVTLTQNGTPVADQLVSFSLSSAVGVISPASGTARTDVNGVAEVSLLAGQVAGSGQVNAEVVINGESLLALPFIFDSLGDDTVVSALTLSLLDAAGAAVRDVAYATPRKLEALVTENGTPVAFRLVTFSVEGAGEINPTTGRAMTDANGIARVDLLAGFVASAGEAQARYTNSEGAEIVSDTFTFTSAGDTPVPGTSPDFAISLTLTNSAGAPITEISQATPGVVQATVVDKDGQPVVNKVVSFSSTLGRIQPAFGTALTDSNGVAQVRLTAGTVEGAGTLTARYQGVEETISFSTLGNEVLSQYLLTLTMLDGAGNPTRNVSKDNQGNLRATLTFDGIPLENQLITFELANNVGEIIPSVGTARTDSNGVAQITLFAGAVPGAGLVTATYQAADEQVLSLPYVFESNGDQSAETSITAELVEASTDTVVRDVDFANPRRVKVTLTQGGVAAAFKLITVESRFVGVINPSSGRAMTDATGVAYLDLLAGNTAGAGEIVARFETTGGVTITSDAFTFTSAGDTPLPGDSPDFTVELRLVSSVSGTDTSEISAANGGQVIATVRDKDANPVVNKVVSFSSSLGSLRPSTGTALTNALGEARISLVAGTAEGAGTVTAQYEAVTSSIGFYTRGDEVDPNQVNATVNFRLLTSCPSDFRTNRDPNNCIETTSISAEQPGILYIEVLREGASTPLAQTLVSATTTLGSISPRTGTAITDANGIALLDLVAGRDVGAGEVSVTALATTRTKAFEIGAVDVDIVVSSSLAVGDTLAAGSTTLISVDISRNGQPYIPPLGVEFTSGCVQAGLAVMDQSVTSIGGVARSTYRASGCVGGDLITATVITGGNTVSGTVVVDVSEAAIGSLEFLDVSAPIIALKGTGGANRTETSIVRFRLIDENGSPVAGRQVDFTLATALGGLELAQANGFTNGDGIVQTVVRSGIVPTPTRVIARSEQTVTSGTVVVTAPSDVLTVSTGLADQNSFSVARSAFNVHALDFDGNEVDLTVSLADHFNNPVPDGTAVNFITEGGSVESSCTTTNGRCAVKWRSQNPRPFTTGFANTIVAKCDGGKPCPLGIVRNDTVTFDQPLGGRATILAYSIGEESFADLNGNGRFDTGEYVAAYDLTEAYIDNNEDGQFRGGSCDDTANPCSPATPEGDQFEEFIDFNNDTLFNAANGQYNGLLCRQEDADAGLCTRQLVNVFQNQEIVMSGAEAFFRLTTYAADCSVINGVTATPVRVNSDPLSPEVLEVQSDPTSRKLCEVSAIDLSSGAAPSVSLRLFISDIYNNPMPLGTTVALSADNGVFVGADSYTFPNTTSRVPVSISFGLTREPATGNEKLDGFLTISVTSPSGLVSSLSVPVRDDR